MIAPALLDLAMRRHRGTPYVLGRWQSAYFSRKFGGDAGRRLAAIKRRLDPTSVVSRGVLFGLELRGVPGALIRATFVPGVAMLRAMLGSPLAGLVRAARRPLASFRGPAFGRGEPAAVGATFAASRPGAAAGPPSVNGSRRETGPQTAAARALNCVNCGECNSVCPVFHESAIRLPPSTAEPPSPCAPLSCTASTKARTLAGSPPCRSGASASAPAWRSARRTTGTVDRRCG